MNPPRVGMALIVKDEAAIIERCLRSFAAHVDTIAVLDTGCADDTMTIAARVCDELGTELRTGTFDWIDDFAAARNAADALLEDCDWLAWIDADDELHRPEALRELAAAAPPDLVAFGAGYNYAQAPGGECLCYLKRERLVRQGAGRWTGRVHEAQHLDGPIEWVPGHIIEWRHRKRPEDCSGSAPRNLRILNAWADDEPDNPRILAYLGTELAATGERDEALRWFRRYCELDVEWPEERAQVHRRMALCLFDGGDVEEAMQLALQALPVHPTWPDTYLTLAEAHYRRGEWDHAIAWAERVLELGEPATLLIVNPRDYDFQPRLVLAGALGELGRLREAVEVAEDADRALPGDERIRGALRTWRAQLKRQETAQAVIAASQVLVAHDEQEKALALLEGAVPHFAVDHPEVVACRSQLRERLLFVADPDLYAEHYEIGGSKPEDFCTDEEALKLAEQLPRAKFLLRNLRDQTEVAA